MYFVLCGASSFGHLVSFKCYIFLQRDSGTTLIEYANAAQGLLIDPNPNSPLNLRAANLLDDDKPLYEANAKVWTRVHAGGMFDLLLTITLLRTY